MSDDLIWIENLRKEYLDVVAVADLNLSIPSGEIFGLIGPNGAGKTTLLRMLATCLEPTSGRILFQGQDLWLDPIHVRSVMGFMPDFFQVYNRLTLREFLCYFGIAHGLAGGALARRVEEVIDLVDLRDKRDRPVRGLSRGMVQRLGLGRAILHRPRLLLLDEPASGLDPLARRDLLALLKKIQAEETTILISSHILGELSEMCTSVGIMHEGRLLESGPTAEIIRKISPSRQIVCRFLGDAAAAARIVGSDPAVSQVRPDGDHIRFAFTGGDAALAELNANLLRAGVGVALLEETRATLQEAYFAIAERNGHAPSA
jgi:ABC-2 type transport system ATP-binding protein